MLLSCAAIQSLVLFFYASVKSLVVVSCAAIKSPVLLPQWGVAVFNWCCSSAGIPVPVIVLYGCCCC